MNFRFRRYYQKIWKLDCFQGAQGSNDASRGLCVASALSLQVAAQLTYGHAMIESSTNENSNCINKNEEASLHKPINQRRRKSIDYIAENIIDEWKAVSVAKWRQKKI
jgi:hypothetical protein